MAMERHTAARRDAEPSERSRAWGGETPLTNSADGLPVCGGQGDSVGLVNFRLQSRRLPIERSRLRHGRPGRIRLPDFIAIMVQQGNDGSLPGEWWKFSGCFVRTSPRA